MKIDLKLSASHLNTLAFHFGTLGKIPPSSRDVKVARSVLDKVALKFQKKHLEVQAEANNLFSKKGKKYKFSLEYHEAHFLEKFIDIVSEIPMNEFDRNVLRLLKTNLNQQLA